MSNTPLRLVENTARCGEHCARLCTDDGFAEIMRAEQGLLMWRAMNSLGDYGLAEQAVQETFLRAWKACASFDERSGSVRAWLLAIARNLAIDLARARAVRPGDTHWDELDDSTGNAPRAGDFVDALADTWLVEDLLDKLPAAQREAVVEVIVRDRAYQDVAAELGVPVGTLKSRVHYGVRAMREALAA